MSPDNAAQDSAQTVIQTASQTAAQRPMALSFSDVNFSYGELKVLTGASFHLHEGEFGAILGPNGTGKTTIIRLMLGLARPDSGSVRVFGQDTRNARSLVGYVPQYALGDSSFPLSVRAVVRMGLLGDKLAAWKPFRAESPESLQAVDHALSAAGVLELATRPYAALSGGQRRRVLVARALVAQPRMLVLDEPTANMDAASEERLYTTLGDLKGRTTIVVVTHDHAFVSSLTDAVLCLAERGTGGSSVVRHAVSPADHAPPQLFGGQALRVLHDTDLHDNGCCGGCT
ncbi:MAG TPA: metal ABC transporter ATP-binding protein [Spirochaetales bacterium]|nr:metal ABC transporter ATP-binding protein [Spirochaetales bacterium]